jgi:hemoglobin
MTQAEKSNGNETKSLFERLGGTMGITKIVDDVVDAHMNNPGISARFIPYKEQPDRVAVIKQHTVEFFSAGSGGQVDYTGKDMTSAHAGMNISAAEYMCAMDDVLQVLTQHNIDEESKKEVLAILWSLKEMIMAK